MHEFVQYLKRNIWLVAICGVGIILLGAISGGLSGGIVAKRLFPTSSTSLGFNIQSSTSTANQKTPLVVTTTPSSIKLVQVQLVDASMRSVPESIFTRRSPVGIIYFHKKGLPMEGFLGQSDQMGSAVAVTSDGWFVTASVVVKDLHTADLLVWYDGKAYRVEKAILDHATQAVFLKTAAKDLPATPFADIWADRSGLAAWLEPTPEEYVPSSIIALRASVQTEPLLSERAERRLVALGSLQKNERGAAFWDAKGALIGIAEAAADGRIQIIPGSNLAASLQSFVQQNEIRHASLGVYVLDRQAIRSMSADASMPSRGAWVKEDKRTGRAIIKDSAAEKAGLKSNDVILQVDRDIMDNSLDLSDAIMQYRPNSSVTLRVWRSPEPNGAGRSGTELDIATVLGSQVTSELLP